MSVSGHMADICPSSLWGSSRTFVHVAAVLDQWIRGSNAVMLKWLSWQPGVEAAGPTEREVKSIKEMIRVFNTNVIFITSLMMIG